MSRILLGLVLTIAVFAGAAQSAFAQGDASKAITTAEPEITPGRLAILLTSLSKAELENEIAGWQALLHDTVARLSGAQLRLQKISAIEAAEEAGEDPAPGTQTGASADPANKDAVAEEVGELLAQRALLLDQFKVVLDEYETKGGDPSEQRLYARAVSGVTVDFSDPQAAYKTIQRWALSEEGGQRLLQNLAIFAAVIVGAWLVGQVVRWILALALRLTGMGSRLLRRFITLWSGRVVFLIGLLMALSALGLNITPLVAALGAAGFVVGFALQNTLSNFASGLLIMTQRPFDVGDAIEAAGVKGTVDQVTLFSTHITTFENSKLVVPNNSIWSSVIRNATASDRSRLFLSFDIKEPITVDHAEETILSIVADHDKVLKDPAPVVRMDELAEEGFKVICWPWVRTGDEAAVRWDVIRAVKLKLQGEPSKTDGQEAEAA